MARSRQAVANRGCCSSVIPGQATHPPVGTLGGLPAREDWLYLIAERREVDPLFRAAGLRHEVEGSSPSPPT